MPRRLTPQSTLDNLKKEAKRWLRALRDNVADARARLDRALPDAPSLPTLRDIQLALAREHGVPGWAALKELLGTADRPTMARYERAAASLLEAYRTGTPEAMERHYAETWHRRVWPAMRRYTLLDLGRVPAPNDEYIDISMDDARLIVAKENSFWSWQALTEYIAQLPLGKRRVIARPVSVFSVGVGDPVLSGQHPRDWDAAIELLQAHEGSGLDAHGQMTDEVLGSIASLSTVTSLRLGGSKALTDAGVLHLAKMPQLRHLDLSGTQVTDRGLDVFRDLPQLEVISLSGTRVTDAGVASLARCDRLECVDLGWTHTGDGAIRALAGKPALRTFSSGNGVTDSGIAYLHVLPVFKTWQETGIDASADMDGGPNSLSLRGPFTDRGLAALVGLDGLFGLNIWEIQLAITSQGLAPLAKLPNLGRLAVEAVDESMPFLAAIPKLRFLMIQDTPAGDEGWVALSKSQSIEQIWGRRCHNLRSRGFASLANMPVLQNLAVSCLNVDDSAIATLPNFPTLRELMPMDIPDEGYRHIGRCENLEVLTLMYCRDTGDCATEHITGLPRLRKYFASYNQITDRTPELLSSIATLEEVEFAGCAKLTDAGIAALAKLPRLRALKLGGPHHITPAVVGVFGSNVKVDFSG